MSALRLKQITPVEPAEALSADEAMATAAVTRWRDEFAGAQSGRRLDLAMLIAAAQRERMNCRARATARICSQRAEVADRFSTTENAKSTKAR